MRKCFVFLFIAVIFVSCVSKEEYDSICNENEELKYQVEELENNVDDLKRKVEMLETQIKKTEYSLDKIWEIDECVSDLIRESLDYVDKKDKLMVYRKLDKAQDYLSESITIVFDIENILRETNGIQ